MHRRARALGPWRRECRSADGMTRVQRPAHQESDAGVGERIATEGGAGRDGEGVEVAGMSEIMGTVVRISATRMSARERASGLWPKGRAPPSGAVDAFA